MPCCTVVARCLVAACLAQCTAQAHQTSNVKRQTSNSCATMRAPSYDGTLWGRPKAGLQCIAQLGRSLTEPSWQDGFLQGNSKVEVQAGWLLGAMMCICVGCVH
jgi:hypothetical protein